MAFKFKDLSILFADNDKFACEIMSAILERLEFRSIHTARDGAEAFALFQKHNHDVVVTDWQMDPVDGIELIRKIRARESNSPNREVPVILATGYTNMKMTEEARDAGATEFLIKPFSADDLAKRIAYVMNKPRDFIDLENYTGPDRRRRKKNEFNGPFKRKEDQK